jgi:hypothetical protein
MMGKSVRYDEKDEKEENDEKQYAAPDSTLD